MAGGSAVGKTDDNLTRELWGKSSEVQLAAVLGRGLGPAAGPFSSAGESRSAATRGLGWGGTPSGNNLFEFP